MMSSEIVQELDPELAAEDGDQVLPTTRQPYAVSTGERRRSGVSRDLNPIDSDLLRCMINNSPMKNLQVIHDHLVSEGGHEPLANVLGPGVDPWVPV
jgi:hypothetical protein